MKKNQLNLKSSLWMLFLLFFSLANVQAQVVAATITSGANNVTPNLAASYTSFANLTTALNAITTMTGAVNITLGGGFEVAPVKGFTIGSTTLNAALLAANGNNSYGGINITGTFFGLNNPLNTNLLGGTGTATGTSASPDGILKLVGADWIAINYVSFSDPIANNTPTTAMEFAVALFKASPTDGCQHNDINTNYFKMQRVNTVIGTAPMIGEAAIIIVNSLPTTATTAITPTANSGASTDNNIANNYIDGGANGIWFYGFGAASPFDFVDIRNNIVGNTILNFGGGLPATSCSGITTRFQWETDIEYNVVDNNDGNGVNNTSNLYGINVFNATNSNSITSSNTITLQSGSTAGAQVYGIYNAINTGANVPNFSTVIESNVIKLAQPLLTTVSNVRGINCISSSQNLSISGNTISGLSPFASTGIFYGIVTSGTATTTTINNNTIKDFNRTAATGTTYGILAQGTAATTSGSTGPTNVIANGNTIDNLTFTATDNSATIYGINAGSNTITNTINNNIVKNLATGTSGSIYGIYDFGIAGLKVCQNNQIFNFSTPTGVGSGTSSSYYGIFFNNLAISPLNLDISSNSIYSLNNSGTGTNGEIYAIYSTALQPSSIYKNKIYDLSYAGSNTNVNGSLSGIFVYNNVSTIYNNVIADLRMPNYVQTTQKLFGIQVNNSNIYHNTIFLNGMNASSAALFTNSVGSLILKDNIFINTIIPNSGGIASAYSRSDTSLSSYNGQSNNNLFAGTTIFYDGTNTDATLAAFKTRMATREQASVTETTTPFTSTIGSNAGFLRLPANAVSVANNAGQQVTSPAITTDYFGVTRSTTTPDIGASEFNGLVCTLPVAYTVTGGGSACGTSVAVGISNSETGMSYQLKRNGTATGTAVAGTGVALAFPNQTVSGTYTVDANNSNASCAQTVVAMTGSAVVTIDVPSVGGTVSGSAAKCSSINSGTLTLSGNTGAVVRWESAVSPFSTWTAIANTTLTNNYTNLPATTQFRAVVQNGSCVNVTSSVATVTVSIINFTGTVQNVSCFGGSNGSLSFTGQGGVAPYTYLWNTGATTNAITGLTAGSYSCTITDAVGCSRLISPVVVTQPAALVVTPASQTNISCFGGSNGAAAISTPTGGTGLYSYNWTPGNPAGDGTRNVTGLTAGTWTCIVTDSNGCTIAINFTVTQPSAAVSGTTVVTNATCNGTSNGTINLTPSGGTAPYTFNWGGGVTTEDRTGLVAGSYSVTITDANCLVTVLNYCAFCAFCSSYVYQVAQFTISAVWGVQSFLVHISTV